MEQKQYDSIDISTFKRLRRLYSLALSFIALSAIISQIVINKFLVQQEGDSTIINIAGRQRMLSQKLSKEILLLEQKDDTLKRWALKEQLKTTLQLWERSHIDLKTGHKHLGIFGDNSYTVDSMFINIEPHFNIILKASKAAVNTLEKDLNANINNNISLVSANEPLFLVQMDGIVNQYNKEAKAKVSKLRKLESLLLVITLAVLLFEFIFIFWPSAKFVKTTIGQLLNSEKKALDNAKHADALRRENERSVQELRKLNELIDKTLLFARVTSGGNINHVGEKFSRLFKISRFSKGIKFAEVISINEQEQDAIHAIIMSQNKQAWQGEVKGTLKQGNDIWLEMFIIPFTTDNENAELLIISTDITTRKMAQLEIEKLTKERYQAHVSNQKLITQKIIENQEKEQNRIAKDMHDGIGQMLTGLKYNLESITPNHVEKTRLKIDYLKTLTTSIIKGVRTATFNLAPPELDDYGLAPALLKLTQELNKFTDINIAFNNKSNFNERLDTLTEINTYRITQEAINNAIKYAKSTYILVTLSHSEKLLSITVDDDGVGFNVKQTNTKHEASGGMGMTFMKERIQYINGRLFINSEKEKGTRITLNIPL